ncbi:MAG: DMT family transporter [Pacificimonas sp.]|jgi:transporter family-2 protein|nr:DMT family transporter [Pacificimonas sp.]
MAGNSPLFYALIMFATGVGIPIMAALNGGLGGQLGSPAAAATILFLTALTVSAAVMLATGLPAASSWRSGAPVLYAGGLFVAFYVLSITWIAPRFGVANAVFFVLIGQIMAAAVIDHFGLLGAPRAPIDMRRAAGIVLMAAGIYFARRT